MPYRWFADAVLVLHFAIVVFVVSGLLLIVAGNLRGWHWVNTWWFRLAHLAAIAVVVAQSWLGITCPLTTFEMWLLAQAGAATDSGMYSGSFIEHWVARLLYYEGPPWVFALAYSLFALAVVAVWWRFPPERKRRSAASRI